MTGQTTAAAERSAHAPEPTDTRCWVCGGAFRGCSYAARVLPPLAQVCSEACAADERFSRPMNGKRARGLGAGMEG